MARGPLLFFLACVYRRVWIRRCRIIVVVGSFGKSSTANAIASVLNTDAEDANNQPHLARQILRLGRRSTRAVMEAGISRKRQMWPLAIMLRPDVVVVTSIGSEHQKALGSLDVTRSEKARMVEALRPDGLAVLNGDDPNVMWMEGRTSARVVRCGLGAENDFRADGVRFRYPPGMDLRVTSRVGGGEASREVASRLVGHSMVFPLLAAWAVAREEKIPEAEIAGRIERVEAVNRRMEPVRLANGAWAIVDDRKALPETISIALRTLAELPVKRRWVLMGDVGGSTADIVETEPAIRLCGTELARSCDRLVLVTADSGRRDLLRVAATRAGLCAESITAFDGDLPAVAEYLREELRPGDVLLIKGRFHERLSRVALALEGREVRCWIPRCEPRLLGCLQCPALLVG